MDLRNFNISFDPYGGLYFSNDSHTYQVNIDGRNNLLLEVGDYPVITDYVKPIYKIQNLDEKSLKQKLKEEEEEREKYNDNSDEQEEEDYYPEDNDYVVIDEPIHKEEELELEVEELDHDYGEHNLKFTFWSPGTDQIKVCYRKHGDIMALYDTYIYDQNNQLIFKSNSSDDSSIYRIRIYPNGEIHFRPIGHSEKKYHLQVLGDEIFLIYNA